MSINNNFKNVLLYGMVKIEISTVKKINLKQRTPTTLDFFH